MEKDPRLINIYLKIHNKRSLTMDDLQYLALYSPECFEKTCKNVVYNFPSAKPIMEPKIEENKDTTLVEHHLNTRHSSTFDTYVSEQNNIRHILNNLHNLEKNVLPQTGVNAKEVKDLLGNLYMELIFPHNDQTSTLYMPEVVTSVDFKV